MADPALFAFACPQHDRRSDLRVDDQIERAWADPSTRVLAVGSNAVATEGDALRWIAPGDAPDGERIYLGEADGRTWFAVGVDEVGEGFDPRTLREAALSLSETDAGLVVHAVGIANWHRTHGFCARCGTPSEPAQGGHVRRCPSCGAQHFPRTDPAVIMLITDDDDRALLGRHPAWPEGRYSTLAGFLEPGEALEDAVRREVGEEVGIRVGEVTYAASQPWPFPASLMVGFFGRASSHDVHVDGAEIEHARWFTRDEVTDLSKEGGLGLPGTLSISRWLIETWHGGLIVGAWT
ncbi:NAD(+) diphosphatase [Solicola gregarius]|uniref:NAD(+) diphosphatase n=1 Tax=Solicola gregarius TaxID=2908642 RepID=A0AA46YL23_9ACTN|nr:NAD(+) diphosphatase [Solicola gregarius]UYM06102.1 NAD(+) diphosphatase [Solicola gregarius]